MAVDVGSRCLMNYLVDEINGKCAQVFWGVL